MKLTELKPRWYALEANGPRVGLTFDCPHCRVQRLGVTFHERGHEAIQDSYIHAHFPGQPDKYIWTLDGAEEFDTLTLTPSIDASASGHWHGFVSAGIVS